MAAPTTNNGAISGYSFEAWARKHAREILLTTEQNQILIDLKPILKQRRICANIKYEYNLGCRAKLIPCKDGFKIVMDKGLLYFSRRRQRRFTLAHEIGHTLFFNIDKNPPQRLKGVKVTESIEESLCDAFASELLMPGGKVKSEYLKLFDRNGKKKANILKRVFILSSLFEVSIGAMARRLIEGLQLWNGVILACRWLPKYPFDNNKDGCMNSANDWAWRISWSIAAKQANRKLFIPGPFKFREGRPKIRWSCLDNICESMKNKEIREISVSGIEVGRIGNLRKILHLARGAENNYKFHVACFDRSFSQTIIFSKSPIEANYGYQKYNKMFLFAIELAPTNL